MSQTDRGKKQWLIATLFGGVSILALYGVSQILNTSESVFAATSESGITSNMIADRTSAASPEMSWINAAGGKLEALQTDVKRLEQALRTTRDQSQAERQKILDDTDKLLEKYESKIATLEAQVKAGQSQRTARQQTGGVNLKTGEPLEEFVTAGAVKGPSFATGGLGAKGGTGASLPGSTWEMPFSREFTLTPPAVDPAAAKTEPPDTLSTYLPAGSYAPALVLSGVDAATSVTSQAEPVPVIFRITGAAVTAGTRSVRGHRIDLTGCTVTGSARGDLSSERVYVRLLKLSCVQDGGRVFERDVAGYMSGAGKAGARGLVVSREGPLVTNAAIAGALGGLAQGVSQVGQTASGADEATFNDALRGAGAASVSGGVSGAANQLSEYYIERAEQYQPVVSLYGGTEVELVFMEGVDLADR